MCEGRFLNRRRRRGIDCQSCAYTFPSCTFLSGTWRLLVKCVFLEKLSFVARSTRLEACSVATTRCRQTRHKSRVFIFWSHGTERIAQTSLRLSRSQGRWGLPCVRTKPQVLAIHNSLSRVTDVHHPALLLILYFLGPLRCDLVPRALGNLRPSTALVPSFYHSVADLASTTNQSLPGMDDRVLPPSRVTEVLCSLSLPSSQGHASVPPNYSFLLLESAAQSYPVQDIQWQ